MRGMNEADADLLVAEVDIHRPWVDCVRCATYSLRTGVTEPTSHPLDVSRLVARWLLWLLSCAPGCGPTEEPACVAAVDRAASCGVDVSTFSCPDPGEADRFQECVYPCYTSVVDCAEFSTSGSPHLRCVERCAGLYLAPPPSTTGTSQ